MKTDDSQTFPGDLWAITSYFNPMSYWRRRLNYQAFRRNLTVPLLTIELAHHDDFELRAGDATRLVQLRSDQVMWQKERLLNLALEELPPECRKVAWLDCDLVFERDDWGHLTSKALEDFVLVQPYTKVHDLRQDLDAAGPPGCQSVWVRDSMAARYVGGAARTSQISSDMCHEYSPGHAWAMRRDALEKVGLYDRLIVGGADNLIAHAAIGAQGAVVQALGLAPNQARHCLDWARQFHQIVNGSLGVAPGNLFHLWHGELEDRRYSERHAILTRHDFDPCRDIAVSDAGCWRWDSKKYELQEDVRSYFQGRKEDG